MDTGGAATGRAAAPIDSGGRPPCDAMVAAAAPVTPIERLLQVETIYVEPAAAALPRGQEVLDRFPAAALIEVPSHWQIPGLHGNEGNVADWNRIKRTQLVLGTLKAPRIRPNAAARATSSRHPRPTAAR